MTQLVMEVVYTQLGVVSLDLRNYVETHETYISLKKQQET